MQFSFIQKIYSESPRIQTACKHIDLNQVRCHIKFNVDENGVVRDKLIVFTMACTE